MEWSGVEYPTTGEYGTAGAEPCSCAHTGMHPCVQLPLKDGDKALPVSAHYKKIQEKVLNNQPVTGKDGDGGVSVLLLDSPCVTWFQKKPVFLLPSLPLVLPPAALQPPTGP